MDTQTQTRQIEKKPIGAILLIVATVLSFIPKIQGLNLVSVITYLNDILQITLAIVIILKKRGIVLTAIIAVKLLLSLISGFSLYSIPFYVYSLALILLALCDMKIEALAKYKKIFYIVFVIGLIINFYIFMTTNQFYFQYPIILLDLGNFIYFLSMLLIADWIANPYKQIKDKEETASTNGGEYYVSMGKHICLLLFTFGIWQLIWIFKSTQFTNRAKNHEFRNPTSKLLLCIFIPFYMLYWTYKTALRIDYLAKEKNIQSDIGTLCLILAIFIPFIPPILMQDKINQILTTKTVAPTTKPNNDIDSLEKFKDLLDKGVITQEDFDKKKAEILGL